jgi:adenylate kinase
MTKILHPRVFVTGVPGVGKTSLVRHPLISHSEFEVAAFSSLMLMAGREAGLLSRVEDLERVDRDTRERLQREAVRTIDQQLSSSAVLIDGHLLVQGREGLLSGVPSNEMRNLRLSHIVVLIADPREILARSSRGSTPHDIVHNDSHSIARLQQLVLDAALYHSLALDVALHVVENPHSKLDETAMKLRHLLSSAVSSLDTSATDPGSGRR